MLTKIIEQKRIEVAQLKKQNLQQQPPAGRANNFYKALEKSGPNIIAEIKKGSPSKGIIREDFEVKNIAQSYSNTGVAALSILTDQKFFYGHNDNMAIAKGETNLPILRKEFIIDEIQLIESQLLQADAILLIVAALSPNQLLDLYQAANELELDVLIECHNANEIECALNLEPKLLGINNRDLTTFKTDIKTTLELKNIAPASVNIVCESGLNTPQDIKLMLDNNINNFLIGEAFMRQNNIERSVNEFLNAKNY